MTAPLADRIRAVLALAEKATPGPWSVEPRHHAQNQVVETDCLKTVDIGPETFRGRSIATVWKPGDHGWQDARPNAAFIASAPEMAALLRECLADDWWRPISEAPTDGTLVILYCTAEDGSKIQTIGWWEAEFEKDGYDDIKDDYNYRGAWTDHGVQSWAYQEYAELSPTHWRPLPAAPGAEL